MDLTLLSRMSVAGVLTIVVLLLCSFLMTALALELRKRSRNSRLQGDWLLAQLHHLLYGERSAPETVNDYLNHLDRPVASICRELLQLEHPTLERGDYLLNTLVERERAKLEQGLSHLGTVAVIAPFVGLFGTVVGITKTFADVAKIGKAGIEVVSAGVSEALVATAIGLLVAIISVVHFTYFKKEFDSQANDWDLTGRALLSLLTAGESERTALFAAARSSHPTESAKRYLEKR